MHDGTQATDQFSQETGATLPSNYEFIRVLGRGSMASVFLVRNTTLRRLVALKVPGNILGHDDVSRKRFVREAQAAARISHPNVTSVYAIGTLDNNLPFIEMQYVDGSNLADLIKSQGQMEPDKARQLLMQIAHALAAAHECGVIHRDVKPANVLIDRDQSTAYLTDFGIAGILETGTEAVTKLTRDSDRLGNPAYMSPEQLRGDPLTEQTDIYSFGVLAYEMLTSHGPFGDADIRDIAAAHIRRAPIDLCEANPEIPRKVGEILRRCLSKKPENRPAARALSGMLSASGENAESDASDEPSGALTEFLIELQKRRVYQAVVAYAAVTFIVLQVADLTLQPLRAPDWVYRGLVIVALVGFPPAMTLSWIFDLRKGRLTRTEASASSSGARSPGWQWPVLQMLGLGLSVAVSVVLAWWLLKQT